ncbi:hypothetical protein [Vibrio genomosp. F6]|uniref:hypothetical protein n=1 Tax=Vibrio genomosp. F6 TaxID=723172 RepID=UPI001482FFA3|nr:hypothetical protein [Vibrio genomosp. F6]
MSVTTRPLKNLLLKVDKWNPVKDGGEELIHYIDLSSVDKDSKKVVFSEVQEVVASSAPSRARQLVSESDILVATVRPNLNGVAKVPMIVLGDGLDQQPTCSIIFLNLEAVTLYGK